MASDEQVRLPSGLMSGEELSEKLEKFKIQISPADLQTLAVDGFLPAWKWKNSDVWYFQEMECRAWFKENWLIRQDGQSVIKPAVQVVVDSPKGAEALTLPRALHPISQVLREVYVGAVPGVYFLLRGSTIVYIGQSTAVPARVINHRSGVDAKDFDRAVYLPLPRTELDRVEGLLIRALNPEYNRSKGPVAGASSQLDLEGVFKAVVEAQGAVE